MRERILKTLGGAQAFGARAAKLDLEEQVEKGLPTRSFDALVELLKLNPEEVNRLLQVSLRTRRRWANRARLDVATSDRLARIARILDLATEVLDDQSNAVEWLREPNYSLGGRKPLDAIVTDIGAERVTNMLHQMEHGIYA